MVKKFVPLGIGGGKVANQYGKADQKRASTPECEAKHALELALCHGVKLTKAISLSTLFWHPE
jgi:hypothetical protein